MRLFYKSPPVSVAIEHPLFSHSHRSAPLSASVCPSSFLPSSLKVFRNQPQCEGAAAPTISFISIIIITPPLTPIHPPGLPSDLPVVHACRGRGSNSREVTQAKKNGKGGFASLSRGESGCLVALVWLIMRRHFKL